MFNKLRWSNKIYVIFQFVRLYWKWSSTATAGAVTAISVTMEDHIRVASSIQGHKAGPFNPTADFTINVCRIDVNKGLRHIYIQLQWSFFSHMKQGVKLWIQILIQILKCNLIYLSFYYLKFIHSFAKESFVRYINLYLFSFFFHSFTNSSIARKTCKQ
jgi:hypothetical protein